MSTAQTLDEHILEIGRQLLDPHDVLRAASGAAAGSLAGLAGTALLHARLAAVDTQFATATINHWTTAARHATRHPGGPGIYASPGGLATSLIIGSTYLPDLDHRHHSAVRRAAAWLSDEALTISHRHRARRRTGDATAPWDIYDAITGLSGIGRILLAASHAGHTDAEPGLHAALNTLTTICTTHTGNRPGWWLPSHTHPPGVQIHPSGAATTGMAHGIAGPLALLSAASTAGWEVPSQTEAIKTAAEWLLRWREPGTWTWPPHVTGRALDQQEHQPTPGRRDAWCYGTPGISRALALAGRALHDETLTTAAGQAIRSVTQRPAYDWDTEGPTLCHGTSGILACTTAASRHEARDTLMPIVAALKHGGGTHIESGPGFLTGKAGTALALAEYGNVPTPPTPSAWNAILLVA